MIKYYNGKGFTTSKRKRVLIVDFFLTSSFTKNRENV